MADYKTYLAANVLNEGRIVSYRLMSRELKVHCNIAKRMLYDFHFHQNAHKGSSVHACYLVIGIPKIVNDLPTNGHTAADGDDTPMQSSPFQSSSQMPQQGQDEQGIPVKSINLVREQDLEELKSTYDQIESIHIYSIGPSSIQNLEVLSECNRTITKQFITEDPLACGKQYGIIQNRNVKRRTGRRPPGVTPAIPGSKPVKRPSTPKVQEATKSEVITGKPEPSISKAAAPDASAADHKPASRPAPKVKREASDIFKSFSKSKTTPKLRAEETSTSLESASFSNAEDSQGKPAVQEDEPMKDASEDEQEDEDFITTSKTDPPSGKSKTARAEELRRMMDDEEDEEMKDAEAPPQADEPAPKDDSQPIDRPPVPSAETSPEPAVTTSGGRRRGRRKVMRKKTIKDEEGYLVTKEEPAWESFSEDEPPPTKERTPFSTGGTSKAKKQATKPGQGNIMTFFGKK